MGGGDFGAKDSLTPIERRTLTMAIDSFDPDAFTRLPNFSTRSGVSLATALLDLALPVETDATRRAARRLAQRADEARAALSRRSPKGSAPASAAPAIDLASDRAWSALKLRLEGYAILPVESNARAAKARELLTILFGNEGLSFVNLPYAEQAAATEAILARIDAESLARDIEQCAGKDFIDAVRAMQPKYEAMVREFLARDDKSENLRSVQLALQSALSQYAVAAIGAIDTENPAHIEAITAALAPLGNHKKAVLRSSSTSDEPSDGGESKPGDSK
jgi:hypothetical protein